MNSSTPWSKAKLIHQKLSEAFDGIQNKNATNMKCASGCSQCCHKKFSIFSWEAYEIITWFKGLTESQKRELKSQWGHYQDKACSFLFKDQCSIYPVRPSICRTQGAPFFIEGLIDVCPLNFENVALEQADCLDLNRINQLISAAEIEFQQLSLFDSQIKLNQSRIELDQLKEFLYHL